MSYEKSPEITNLILRFFLSPGPGDPGVIAPIVLRVCFRPIVPGIPFLLWQLMADIAFFIKYIGIFAEEKIQDFSTHTHKHPVS